MEGENSPEYQAINENRFKLEDQSTDHLKSIAGRLRTKRILTDDRYAVVVDEHTKNGCEKLIDTVLKAIKVDPLKIFFTVTEVMKDSGNITYHQVIEKIEARRKEFYREKLRDCAPISGGKYTVLLQSIGVVFCMVFFHKNYLP